MNSDILKTTVKNPGNRSKVDKCELCQKAFGMMMNKQHQCKRCLRPICNECGKEKAITYHFDPNQTHRICKLCKIEQTQIEDQIDQNNLRFAHNSIITARWLKYFNDEQNNFTEKYIDQRFETLLTYINSQQMNQVILNSINQVQSIYQQLLEDLHYSQWELNYRLTKDLQVKDICLHVSNIISILLFQNPSLIFDKKLVQETLMFLYYNGPGFSYFFMNYIYTEFLPERYRCGLEIDSQPQEEEVEFLLEISKTNYLIESIDLVYVRKFLESYSNFILSHMLSNIVNSTCMFFLLDDFLKNKDFYDCQKTLGLVIKLHLNEIKAKCMDQQYLLRYILNNTLVTHLKDYYCKEDRVRNQQNQKSNLNHSKTQNLDVYQQFNEHRAQSVIMNNNDQEPIALCLQLFEQALNSRSIDEVSQNKLMLNLKFTEQRQFNKIVKRISQLKQNEQIDKNQIQELIQPDYRQQNESQVLEENQHEVQLIDLKNQLDELHILNQSLRVKSDQQDQIIKLGREQIDKSSLKSQDYLKQIQDLEIKNYNLTEVLKKSEKNTIDLIQHYNESQLIQDNKLLTENNLQLEQDLLNLKTFYEDKLIMTAQKQTQILLRITEEYEQPVDDYKKQEKPQIKQQTDLQIQNKHIPELDQTTDKNKECKTF